MRIRVKPSVPAGILSGRLAGGAVSRMNRVARIPARRERRSTPSAESWEIRTFERLRPIVRIWTALRNMTIPERVARKFPGVMIFEKDGRFTEITSGRAIGSRSSHYRSGRKCCGTGGCRPAESLSGDRLLYGLRR